MKKRFPTFKRKVKVRGKYVYEAEHRFNQLPKKERVDIDTFLVFRRSRRELTLATIRDIRTRIVALRTLFEKDLSKLNLKTLRQILSVVNGSNLGNSSKNNVKTDLKSFIKWKFPNWSKEFSNLEDIRNVSNPVNKRPITPQNLPTKKDVEKLMKHEGKMFWKAFLITQYEAGLRTKETRYLRWEDINFNIDGDISELNIFSTKTKQRRSVFIKEATFYLQKLKEEQENLEQKGVYIFHSLRNLNEPVNKGNISTWMTNLSKRALGRHIWNYMLRHSRATELYKLARETKISEDTATGFMGHNKSMRKVYEQLDTKTIKNIIKNQIYKIEEIPEERKRELEKEIENLKKITHSQTGIVKALIERITTGKLTKANASELIKNMNILEKID